MRKLLTFVIAVLISSSMFAGGLVTNTNQSAAWVRLPSRNASTSIDAAYFNPAGLMKLENGFHISLSNQTIFQTREITNSYYGPTVDAAPSVEGVNYGLNQHTYKGTVTAPLFPTVYAAYKMDKFAFSLGFGPVGGGGGAVYEEGLPSFEMSPSDLVPSLAAKAGIKGYRLDAYLKGSSAFLGFQGGISYKINDIVSVALGLRYVTAKNTYEGHLQDIQLNKAGNWVAATDVLHGLAAQLTGGSASLAPIVSGLAPALTNGYGGLTLAQLVGAGAMSPEQQAGIEAGLTGIGVPTAAIPLMNAATISATVTTAINTMDGQAASLTKNAALLVDQSADVAQTGHGIAPIFSINISPNENVNIAIKYEMKTKLELTNKTVKDLNVGYDEAGNFVTMFPNGEKIRNDMPAQISVGGDFKLTPTLKLSLSTNYFFDKSADYGHKINGVHVDNKDIITDDGISFQGGLEYNISQKFLVSGGYVWANKGVNSLYQSDLTYGLGTQTFGFGGAYNVNEKIQVNLGAGYTKYESDGKAVNHLFGTQNVTPWETYKKSTFMVGIGVDLRF